MGWSSVSLVVSASDWMRFPIALVAVCWGAAGLVAQQTDTGSPGPDLQAIVGSWKVTSAVRDGVPFDRLLGVRYFIEPGLMRWADPKTRSEHTKLPVLMGRRIKHRSGDLYDATTIYPPEASSEMELKMDGNQLVITTDRKAGSSGLELRLDRVSREVPKPPLEKMVTLGKEANTKGRYDAGYQFAQLQLINFPEDAEGIALLAISSMRIAASKSGTVDTDKLDRAREQASWAVQQVPGNDTLRNEFAHFLYFSREFGLASEQFSQLLEKGQLSADDLVTYAQCEVLLSRLDNAKKLLSVATGFDTTQNKMGGQVPDKPNSGFLTLAILLMRLGNASDGQLVMDAFVSQFPTLSTPYLHRGRYRLLNGDRDGALEDFRKALEVSPDDRDAMLVNIEAGLNVEGDENDKLIARAFELFGRDPMVLTLACARASLMKRYDESLTLAVEGLQQQPNSLAMLALKTQAEIQIKDFAAAEASIASMAEHGFHAVAVDLMRARLLIAQDKLDDADAILNRLSQIELPQGTQPQLANVLEMLAEARRQQTTASESP